MSFPKNGQSYQPKTQISRKYLDEFSSLEIPGYVHKGLHCVREWLHWLISDLIPKKTEKFELRKNFVTIFFSVKNWPKKQNFDFFCPRNFRKIAKLICRQFCKKFEFQCNFAIFRKLRGQKKSKFHFFGSVFDSEKYGHKIFSKCEFFGFFRN